jgi:hypothetical protein
MCLSKVHFLPVGRAYFIPIVLNSQETSKLFSVGNNKSVFSEVPAFCGCNSAGNWKGGEFIFKEEN